MAAPGRSGSLARGRTEGRQLASGTPLYLVHLQDHPQNEGVFSQGRFSKEDEAPPEARRTTSKCPLKRRTLQSPELAEISLLLVSGRIFLFFVFLFFLFFLFSFFFSFFFFSFQRITRAGNLVTFLTPHLEERKISGQGPTHSESFFKACGNKNSSTFRILNSFFFSLKKNHIHYKRQL